MSFVKSFLLIALVVGLAQPVVARAEGVMFQISSSELPPPQPGEENQGLVNRLKHRAVINWLQNHLGTRYERFAGKVTPDFAEKYILEYKINRPNPKDRNHTVLTGTLDTDSLKRWLRVTEVKAQGSSVMKPVFILSSDVPGLTLAPRESSRGVAETKIGDAIYSHLSAHFQKFNTRLPALESGAFPLLQPARSASEVRALTEFGAQSGYNGAVWAHVAACKSCGGSRLELYYFNLIQGRASLMESEDLGLDGREFSNVERVRAKVKAPLTQFCDGFDDLVQQGTLFSGSHRVVVEGIESFRVFKAIDTGMGKLDFVTRAVVKKAEVGRAEYEIISSLGAEELLQRFHLATFPGFQLKPVRLDGATVVVRYSR